MCFVGVAGGETVVGVAHPLVTIDDPSTDARFAVIGDLIDLPDRVPEGAVLPGHYDPASGHTESMRGMAGSEAGVIPSLPPGLGGKP